MTIENIFKWIEELNMQFSVSDNIRISRWDKVGKLSINQDYNHINYLRTCRTQCPRGSLSNNIINTAEKAGWTRIPTVKSVKARNASKTLDLCTLSRDFVWTEIITSAFKTAVTGKVRRLTMIRKIKKATLKEEGCCSLFPNTRSASQPVGLVSELEFMAYSLTISRFSTYWVCSGF